MSILTELPNCSKCNREMELKPRTIKCETEFLGVTDLVCVCGHKIENVFNLKCKEDEDP